MSNAERFQRLLESPGVNLRSRTIRGGLLAMAAEGVGFVLRLASIMVLARLLVPEHFGLVAMVAAITAIAERFKDLGLSVATIQRQEISYEQVSTLFWINAATGIVIMLLVAALAVPVAQFYDDSRLVAICIAIASTFLFSGITIQHQALLRRMMKFGRLAALQIGSNVASITIAVGMALMDYGYWALVAREISHSVFLALGTWVCVPWIPGRPSRGVGVKSMLALGGDVTAFNLIWFLTSNLDQIVVGKIFGASSLGLYRQGINLVVAPIAQLTYPVNSVAEAALSRLQDAAERYRHYYVRFLSALASITMPLALFLVTFAGEVVEVALGPRWVAASEFVRILAIAAAIRPAVSTAGFVMVTCGKSRRYLWWGLFQSVALSVFLVLGVTWGPKGVAYAHVASSYLLLGPVLYFGLKDTPITMRCFASAVWKPLIASLSMAAVLQVSKQAGFVEGPVGLLVLGSGLALPVYIGTWFLLPGGRAEVQQAFVHVLSVIQQPNKC